MSNRPTPIGGRYAFHGLLKSQHMLSRWLTQDVDHGRQFVAALLPPHRLKHVEAAQGACHAHLAAVTQVIRDVEASSVPEGMGYELGAAVALADYVPGQSLHHFQAGKPLPAAQAVAWVLRLAEAVQVLHAQGAVHGSISPWSIIAAPEGLGAAPVLSALVAPAIGPYLPPERLKGGVDQEATDVWALHAVLYTALTGVAPFAGTDRALLMRQMLVGRLAPLATLGVHEPVLNEILVRGLNGEKRLRMTELSELIRTLDAWEHNPKAMPLRRSPGVRPKASTEAEARIPADQDPVVIDGASLPSDEGALQLVPRPRRSMPPLPVAAAVASPNVSMPAAAPRLPASLPVGPPPLPVSMPVAAPALPASVAAFAPGHASAQPAMPVLASGRVPPPLPVSALPVPARPPEDSHEPRTRSSSGPSLEELSAQLLPALPPPALGPSHSAHISKRLSFNPFEKKRRVWPMVVSGAVGGGLGVYLLLSLARAPVAAPANVSSAAPRVEPPAAAPQTSKPKISSEARRDACVAAHLPDGMPPAETNFAFVCEDTDFRTAARRLFAGVRTNSKELGPAGLGWYELPATGIIRKSCCEAAATPVLPKTAGWCEQLENAVRRVADDSAKAGDLGPAVRGFDKAVQCLFANHIAHAYSYERVPSDVQRRGFQHFVSLAAINEARR